VTSVTPLRVVIAEDAAVLRDGLVQLLDSRGFEVLADVADAEALLAAVREHRPDVAVVDVRMPPTRTDEGLRAALELRRDHPELGVLVFSQYIETRYATELLAAGAERVGYLLKDRVTHVNDFIDAVRRVAAGGTVLDPEVVTQLFGATRRVDGLARLTRREHEVLALMAEGRSNAAIAAAMVVSPRAVEKHIANVFTKLDLLPSDDDHRRVLAVLRYLRS
jgi:DNA-binding NarL/FixJ family response regulator